MIDHLTQIILNCTTNSPTPEAGARLAAYRITDELRKAMLDSDVIWVANKAKTRHLIANERNKTSGPTDSMRVSINAAWDAVLDGKEAA